MAESRTEVVVITGASAGVGRATAREFARRGTRIGLLARGREGLEAAQRFTAMRTAARAESRARLHGAVARAQYAAV